MNEDKDDLPTIAIKIGDTVLTPYKDVHYNAVSVRARRVLSPKKIEKIVFLIQNS